MISLGLTTGVVITPTINDITAIVALNTVLGDCNASPCSVLSS